MIIYEEEYLVEARHSKKFLELIEKFEKMVKTNNVPFLKDWYFLSKKYEIGKVRNVWVLEEQANVDVLWDEYPSELSNLVPQIWECVVEGSYKSSFWNIVASK